MTHFLPKEMVQSQNEENISITAFIIITLTSYSGEMKLKKELAERHDWSFARQHSLQSQTETKWSGTWTTAMKYRQHEEIGAERQGRQNVAILR